MEKTDNETNRVKILARIAALNLDVTTAKVFVPKLKPEHLGAILALDDAEFTANVDKLIAKFRKPWRFEAWNIRESLDRTEKPNPDALINCATNYLARGSAIVYNSTTGAGKSVLAVMFIVFMACGISFFGQKPARRLKCILVQNENDVYDCFEAIKGAIFYASQISSFTIEEITKMVEENIVVGRLNCSGDELPLFIREKVDELKSGGFETDCVVVDPLLGYFGGLLDPDKTQQWLYTKMTPVMQECRFLLVLTHHTTAAAGRAGGRNGGIYSGFGGAVLPGWVRAVVNIEPVDKYPDLFVLVYEKRASRLGDKNRWYMRKGQNGMVYWEMVDAPADLVVEVRKTKKPTQDELLQLKINAKIKTDAEKRKANTMIYRHVIEESEELTTERMIALLIKKYDCSQRKAEHHLAMMVETGLIMRHKVGGKIVQGVYDLPGPYDNF